MSDLQGDAAAVVGGWGMRTCYFLDSLVFPADVGVALCENGETCGTKVESWFWYSPIRGSMLLIDKLLIGFFRFT